VTQIDLENTDTSGLIKIQPILEGLEGVRFVQFSERDVVRHRLVRDIILAFDRHHAGRDVAPSR
jgi:phosphate starvation-inducible PhoH-like protein